MSNDLSHITGSVEYKALLQRRRSLMVPFIFSMLVGYYGFIVLIAFAPAVLSQRLGDGVSTLGIWLGLGLIFLTFAVTILFVILTNQKIKPLLDHIHHTHGDK